MGQADELVAMLTRETCQREIVALHEFFVEWYHGNCDREAFERMEAAIAPSFELVSPDGIVHDRETIVGYVRDSYDSHDPGEFDIEIRNVTPVEIREDRALIRYEEWQDTPDGLEGRLSTALFGPTSESASDDGQAVEWLYLQETWLED